MVARPGAAVGLPVAQDHRNGRQHRTRSETGGDSIFGVRKTVYQGMVLQMLH